MKEKKLLIMLLSCLVLGFCVLLGGKTYAANIEGLPPKTDTYTFKKVVHSNNMKNVPTYTYSFTAKEVSGTPDGGVVKNNVKNMPIIADATTTTQNWADSTTINDNRYQFNKIQNVQLSATFSEVGTYKYTVTEKVNGKATGILFDVVFDVYKAIDGDAPDYNTLAVSYFDITNDGTKGDDYDSYISSKVDTYIQKEVAGVKGDTTKDFSFNIEVTDILGETTQFNYEKQELVNGVWSKISDGIIDGSGIVALKHNQRVVIKNLEVNSTYSVTETKENLYTTKIDFVNPSLADKNNSVQTGSIVVTAENNGVKFINTKTSNIQTGVVNRAMPYIGILLVALLGIVVIIINKTRKINK